mgnify:CR=1 FL=1
MKAESLIATCGGVGFLPLAPGTWGSLLGLVIGFGLLALDEDGWLFLVCLMMLSPVALWAVNRYLAGSDGDNDPKEVVIDEAIGQWVALTPIALSGGDWRLWALAFVLFRFFDILIPWPVAAAERLPGAFGVLADDVVAGALAALCVVLVGAFHVF